MYMSVTTLLVYNLRTWPDEILQYKNRTDFLALHYPHERKLILYVSHKYRFQKSTYF